MTQMLSSPRIFPFYLGEQGIDPVKPRTEWEGTSRCLESCFVSLGLEEQQGRQFAIGPTGCSQAVGT